MVNIEEIKALGDMRTEFMKNVSISREVSPNQERLYHSIVNSSVFVPSLAKAVQGAAHPWERKASRGVPGLSPHPSVRCFSPVCPRQQTWLSQYSSHLQVGENDLLS